MAAELNAVFLYLKLWFLRVSSEKRTVFFSIFILLSLLSKTGFAEPCPVEDFELDAKGGSMEFVQARDQGDWNSCYAFAAAQAIDAFRFSSLKTENKTLYSVPLESALFFATSNFARDGNNGAPLDTFEYGVEGVALAYYVDHGGCVSPSTKDPFIEAFGSNTKSQCMNFSSLINERELALQAGTISGAKEKNIGKCMMKPTFMPLNEGKEKFIKSVFDSLEVKERNTFDRLRLSMRKNCQSYPPSRNLNGKKIRVLRIFNPSDRVKKSLIASQYSLKLISPPQPTLVQMCLSSVRKEENESFYNIPKKVDSSGQYGLDIEKLLRDCKSKHTVLVIGMKTKQNSCLVKIRDSYGIKKTTKMKAASIDNEHQYWLKFEDLSHSTYSISYLIDQDCPKGRDCF